MAANNGLTLKLLVDTKANKVLFAEANKEAVDFLFSLLALPLGTVTKLLTKDSMIGCLGNLYKSVESLDQAYIVDNANKTSLLNPKTTANNTLFLTQAESSTQAVKKYYRCSSGGSNYSGYGGSNYSGYGGSNCRDYVADMLDAICPGCRNVMRTEIKLVGITTLAENVGNRGTGFVKGVVTYTVMDDLTVMPMSTISSITMLNKFQVKDIGSLVEKHVELDIKQGLKLLKASLQSTTALTDVFLGNKCN